MATLPVKLALVSVILAVPAATAKPKVAIVSRTELVSAFEAGLKLRGVPKRGPVLLIRTSDGLVRKGTLVAFDEHSITLRKVKNEKGPVRVPWSDVTEVRIQRNRTGLWALVAVTGVIAAALGAASLWWSDGVVPVSLGGAIGLGVWAKFDKSVYQIQVAP